MGEHKQGEYPMSLDRLGEFLREHLLNDVMPFWMKHSLDEEGGINSCISDDGAVVSRDKWLWSQWRAVWVFCRLYRTIEPRDEWQDAARGIYRFAAEHGWQDGKPGWGVLTVDGQGNMLRGVESIYVDAFAIYAMAEMIQVTGDAEVIALVRQVADTVIKRLEAPHDEIPHFPYPVPKGARVHGLPMVFSQVLWDLGQVLDDDGYREAALGFQRETLEKFYRADRDLQLERVAVDGSELPSPDGTAVVPGHVIEDMWFQIHIARDRGDEATIDKCVHMIRRHMELGWDQQYGGLMLGIDADGGDEIGWKFADTKLWWPHTEAMYALLLAHKLRGEKWALDWYWKVHEVAMEHYPNAEHGEWTQKLDRQFRPLTDVVALPVKDPFHLPRALILCVELLQG